MSIFEFEELLKKELSEDSNLFIHGVETSKEVSNIISSIFRSGLKCSYTTIFRTVRDIGKVGDIDDEKLYYVYHTFKDGKSINILLSIPDMLVYNDQFLPVYPQKLLGDKKIDDGGFQSFLDVVLGDVSYGNCLIPKEFIYGYYNLDTKTKEVSLVKNPLFYKNLNDKKYKEFFDSYKKVLIDTGREYLIDFYKSEKGILITKNVASLFKYSDNGISEIVVEKILNDERIKQRKSNKR